MEEAGQKLTPVSDPVSRTEIVASRIRAAILQGQLRPGEALVERDLAQMLGVSKTPIREALQALSNTGLVTFTPFKGSAVRVVDQELAWSIYEVRLLLEPEAVRLSTPNFRSINREASRDRARQRDSRERPGRLRRSLDGEPALPPVDLE